MDFGHALREDAWVKDLSTFDEASIILSSMSINRYSLLGVFVAFQVRRTRYQPMQLGSGEHGHGEAMSIPDL